MSLRRFAYVPVLFFSTLGLATQGCTSDGGPNQTTKTTHLSDYNRDGLFSSDACVMPDGATDEECVILPGPAECSFLVVTETTTTEPDGSVTVVDCVACYDEAGAPIGEESCSGVVDPVICEPGVSEFDPLPPADGPECWTCHTPDGTVLYTECIDPPVYCYADEECPAGSRCEVWTPPPCGGAEGDGSGGAPAPDIAVPGGQCVPEVCVTNDDCRPGEECVIGWGPTDPGTGGGAEAPIAETGYCALPPPPPPPPVDCASHLDEGSCVEDAACYWDAASASCQGGLTPLDRI